MKNKFIPAKVSLSNGVKFTIYVTIDKANGPVNTLEAALDNWLARTEEYTAKSFVDYINSKGMHKAFTESDYKNNLPKRKNHVKTN